VEEQFRREGNQQQVSMIVLWCFEIPQNVHLIIVLISLCFLVTAHALKLTYGSTLYI
jgi:hypothetical protein